MGPPTKPVPVHSAQERKANEERAAADRSQWQALKANWASSLIAMGALGVSLWALNVSVRNLNETKRSANAAEVSAKAATRSASEASAQTEQSRISNQRAQESLDSSNVQAERSLSAAVSTTRLDQRAWVTIKGVSLRNVGVGLSPTIQIGWENSGRSPALNVTSLIQQGSQDDWIPKGELPMERMRAGAGTPARSVLGPGVVGLSPTLVYPYTFTAANIASLSSGQSVLFVYGLVQYDDIFSRRHKTEFCYRSYMLLETMEPCERWNRAD